MSRNSQILLEEIIKQERDNFDQSITEDKFFEFYSTTQILKGYELSYEEIESGLTGESHDGGVDAVFLFINGELVKEDENIKEKYKKNANIELVIIQAKNTTSFNETPLLKFSRLSKNLLNLDFNPTEYEGRYNKKVLNTFELFKNSYLSLITKKPLLKIKYFYCSKGIELHPNVKKQAEELEAEVKELLTEAEVEVNFVGADNLLKLIQARSNDVFRLKVSENPMSSSGEVFIALVNLRDFYNFLTDDNGDLIKYIFESNVRDYQGKTNVNTEIQETLENNTEEEFWWFNNGVTIVATEVSAPGRKELVIHNPEIVNGLQTSSEIYNYFNRYSDAIDSRNLLVRVIVPETEETRDKIIRATNSQTPIPKSSLRATDSIHRQIEDFMKPRGLFYDRRKNFYKNEGKKPKEIISVSFLAQCLMSVLMQKPNFARARPSTLLEDDGAYGKLYHKSNDLNTYYIVARLGRDIELTLKETGEYSSSEINDIRFYILYSIVALSISNIYPSNSSVSKLDLKSIDRKFIKETIEFVYDLYMTLGGSEKVAKGPRLTDLLKEKLRERIDMKREVFS